MLAKKLNELGDADLKASDFWEKYKTEEDFVNEMLAPAPGRVMSERLCRILSILKDINLSARLIPLRKAKLTVDKDKKVVKENPLLLNG